MKAELRQTLEIRDAVTRLTRDVARLRTIRRQLADRKELLAKDDKAKALVATSKTLIDKRDDLEGRIHNPKAEVVYDILAMRGGPSSTPAWPP